MSGVVPLGEADASCGAKASTLARLTRAGFAVPDGVVVRDAADSGWEKRLPEMVGRLRGSRFAVRSSAPGEDSASASFAGQYLTILDVPVGEVPLAAHRVAASSAGVAAYAAATRQVSTSQVAVLVQSMLTPVAAGVAFTRHPLTGVRQTVVEAVHGLGDRLVAGSAEPQRWQSDAEGDLIASGTPGVLSLAQAQAVIALAQRVEALLGGGQDVEWALDAEGELWVLQARPITTGGAGPPTGDPSDAGRVSVTGTAASPGMGRGRVRVLSDLDDFTDFQVGEVLVCRATSPAWTPVLARAAAAVTEIGGILSHAAIVARELRIPAVTGVPEATDLSVGALVMVDGTRGTITLLEDL